MDNIYSIRMGSMFPMPFRFLGAVIAILGAGLVLEFWWSAFLIPLGLFFALSSEGTDIDLSNKKYREYFNIFGYKNGEWESFNLIDMIYLNPSRSSQRIYTKITTTSTIYSEWVNGYIMFDGENKVHLIKGNNKDKVIEKIKPLAHACKISITDNTEQA